MSSSFEFTALSGSEPYEPICYLLQIDEFRLLLDIGWNSSFNETDLSGLKSIDMSTIDAILLSQPDLLHTGALVYAQCKLGLNAPIYCTDPIWRISQYMIIDAFLAVHQTHANFNLFTHHDIKHVYQTQFAEKLKYTQQTSIVKQIPIQRKKNVEKSANLKSKSVSLQITPYEAGHMVGGTIWKITKDTETIVYAIDHNIRREKHLNQCNFADLILSVNRPSLLITDALIDIESNALLLKKRKDRDLQLCHTIHERISDGGNILIPCDAGGRSLEILMILYHYFSTQKHFFADHHLVFLCSTAKNILKSAKSMLEWMCKQCQIERDLRQTNAFEMNKLTICQTMNEFRNSIRYPYICIASNEYLENGFSFELFLKLYSNKSNLILLVERCHSKTLAGKLFNISQNENEENVVEFEYYSKCILSLIEKEEYLAKQRKSNEQTLNEKRQSKIMFINKNISSVKMKQKQRIKRKKNLYPMYPYNQPLINSSVYGKNINLNDFRSETKFKNRIKKQKYLNRKKQKRKQMMIFVSDDENEEYSDMDVFEEDDDYESEDDVNEEQKRKSKKTKVDIVDELLHMISVQIEPFKTMKHTKKVNIECQVQYINVEGRTQDSSAIKMTLQALQPRQIILVHGSLRNKTLFREILLDNIYSATNVQIGENMELLKIECRTKMEQITIDDYLDKRLKFVAVRDFEIAFLHGKMEIDSKKSIIVRDDENKETDDEMLDVSVSDDGSVGYKVVLDTDYDMNNVNIKLDKFSSFNNERSAGIDDKLFAFDAINYPRDEGHTVMFVGEKSKLEMEHNMMKVQIPCKIMNTVLICGRNGEVRLTSEKLEHSTNVVRIDATLSNDYFQIRDRIQSHFHMI